MKLAGSSVSTVTSRKVPFDESPSSTEASKAGFDIADSVRSIGINIFLNIEMAYALWL